MGNDMPLLHRKSELLRYAGIDVQFGIAAEISSFAIVCTSMGAASTTAPRAAAAMPACLKNERRVIMIKDLMFATHRL